MSATTGINSIDALAYSSWNTVPGSAATLTYRFLTSVPSDAAGNVSSAQTL
eukprot:gene38185-47141_t